MADVITRFKLETTQYDSKLRSASQQLSEYGRKAMAAGNEFNKFTQGQAEAARSFGNISTSATNAKDKIKELVGAYNEAAKAYNMLTKEQQQSDWGKALSASLVQLKGRIAEAKQELYGLDAAAKQVKSDMGGFDANKLMGGLAGKFGMSTAMFTGVGAAAAGAGVVFNAIKDNVQIAMGFEQSMSQLSSLTGMAGKDLDRLKEYAIELGSTTTLTASQVADAFRMIGSQQPQLLKSGEALKEVTKYAITLSEAAGIDLVTASQTLSTSINQMGGDSNNAARFVNVLAAASQKGAGDISWLGEAITKSATAAKAVGTDYEELVSNLEQLAKAGFDASTAGTALRSIIMNLEKQSNNEFKPSVVGLTTAFDNLGKAQLSIVQYQDIVGKMFASQAMALANAAGEARNMTDAITGTNIAEQQATTNVDNLSGAIKQLESAWEGLNLHINDSNGPITSFVNDLTTTVRQVDILATKIKGVIKDVPVIGSVLEAYGKYMAAFLNPGAAVGKLALDTFVGDPTAGGTSKFSQKDFLNKINKQVSTFDNRIFYTPPPKTKVPSDDNDDDKQDNSGSGNGRIPNAKAVASVFTPAEGSLPYLQNQLKAAQTLQSISPNVAEFDSWSMIIEELTRQIQIFKGEYKETFAPEGPAAGSINYQIEKVKELTDAWKNATNDTSRIVYAEQLKEQQEILDRMQGKEPKGDKTPAKESKTNESVLSLSQKMTGGIQSMVQGIEGLGVELPKGMSDIIGGIQTVTSILTGISALVSAIEIITAADAAIPFFAQGGVVRAANGFNGVVPGTHLSGDVTPILANAGETVLTAAQAGNINTMLQDAGRGGAEMQPYVNGEQIWLGLNNFLRRSGRGELVTARR